MCYNISDTLAVKRDEVTEGGIQHGIKTCDSVCRFNGLRDYIH